MSVNRLSNGSDTGQSQAIVGMLPPSPAYFRRRDHDPERSEDTRLHQDSGFQAPDGKLTLLDENIRQGNGELKILSSPLFAPNAQSITEFLSASSFVCRLDVLSL